MSKDTSFKHYFDHYMTHHMYSTIIFGLTLYYGDR